MSTSTIKGNMTTGNPLKLMMQFALPLLMGNLLQQTYNIIDAAIVGQILGAKALASVGSSSSIQFLVLGFCMGSCAGFGVPIAKYFGAGDLEKMKKYVFNGAVLTAGIAAIVTVICSVFCHQILHMLSVPGDIYKNAYAYLLVIFLGIPFTLLYNYLSSILRSIGDSKTPFLFLAFSAVLNIFLDLFCIVVLKWGCAGTCNCLWIWPFCRADPDFCRKTSFHDLCEQKCSGCTGCFRKISAVSGIFLLVSWNFNRCTYDHPGTWLFYKSRTFRCDRNDRQNHCQSGICGGFGLYSYLLCRSDCVGGSLPVQHSHLSLQYKDCHKRDGVRRKESAENCVNWQAVEDYNSQKAISPQKTHITYIKNTIKCSILLTVIKRRKEHFL